MPLKTHPKVMKTIAWFLFRCQIKVNNCQKMLSLGIFTYLNGFLDIVYIFVLLNTQDVSRDLEKQQFWVNFD